MYEGLLLAEVSSSFWGFDTSMFAGKSMSDVGQLLLNYALIWLGMATLVGCLAKLLLPGLRPQGTCATLILGMFSSSLGCLLLLFVFKTILRRQNFFNPISIPVIVVSVVIAVLFLWIYQLIARSMESKP